jgi:putative MATE family efflux protein
MKENAPLNYLKQGTGFYKGVLALMLPMIAQNFMTSFMALADTFMVGVLGETELAAVTMANAPFFIVMLMNFGLQSGASVLVAQYHGRGNTHAVNRVLGIGLYISSSVTALLAIVSFSFPEMLMRLLTNNEALIAPGAAYARIVGFSYFFFSVSGLYVAVQRSMENPKVGAIVLSSSGLLNVFLNYLLIFGKLGFPRLGIEGAAVATLISRVVEVAVLVPYAIRNRRLPLEPKLLFRPGRAIAKDFVRYSLPVLCNELLWSLAFSLYSVIIGHMPNNTPLLAAYTIAGNMDRLLSVGIFACGGATAVVIGREIGKGNRKEIYGKSIALNAVALSFGILSSAVILLARGLAAERWIFPLMGLSAEAGNVAMYMLLVLSIVAPLRSLTMTNIVGIFRGGGDVRFGMLTDILPMYLFCVPLAALAGLVLGLGIRVVYVCVYLDDIVKVVLCVWRLRSRKWINDVTREGV